MTKRQAERRILEIESELEGLRLTYERRLRYLDSPNPEQRNYCGKALSGAIWTAAMLTSELHALESRYFAQREEKFREIEESIFTL